MLVTTSWWWQVYDGASFNMLFLKNPNEDGLFLDIILQCNFIWSLILSFLQLPFNIFERASNQMVI